MDNMTNFCKNLQLNEKRRCYLAQCNVMQYISTTGTCISPENNFPSTFVFILTVTTVVHIIRSILGVLIFWKTHSRTQGVHMFKTHSAHINSNAMWAFLYPLLPPPPISSQKGIYRLKIWTPEETVSTYSQSSLNHLAKRWWPWYIWYRGRLSGNFCQLLALCYHNLVSDQDFKDSCDKTAIFKVECTSLQELVVFESFGQTWWI